MIIALSLEQLHRFMFVLGITHVSYSFAAIALAMIKIYSWRAWENEAKTKAIQSLQDPSQVTSNARFRRLSTFIVHQTSPIPGVSTKFLFGWFCFYSPASPDMISTTTFFEAWTMSSVTLLVLVTICQNRSMTSSHRLPELMHMLMGVNFVPLWIYAICSIFLDFHGSHFYFWLSFIPAILILVIGTKLHRVVVKLAVEIMDRCPYMKHTQFNLRDELFWFGKPRLLLWLIQLKSFLWEIREPSCFMDNRTLVVIRLSFRVISQIWCSFITFPLWGRDSRSR
ncbi:hypothetical protein K1719_019377 [Acacia pycnantha]|nr:hypothetical protein K1719_019377 [Acacia pycnantha]